MTTATYPKPLRLQDHEIEEARRLLADLRALANPRPSFLYDRYLAPAITDLEDEVYAYEAARQERDAGPDTSCRYCGTSAEWADAIAHRDCPGDGFAPRTSPAPIPEDDGFLRCESGWTGDRCYFRLGHEGPHSND